MQLPDNTYQLGRDLARGFLFELWAWFVAGLVLAVVTGGLFGWGRDDSDASQWNPSGLRVFVDHRTGVQYLQRGDALIVRRDLAGNPVTDQAK